MASKIILQNYDSLLKEVRNHVERTAATIESAVVRQKVEMAWSIGKSISVHLKKNADPDGSKYGKHLLKRLESDVGIASAVLYKMRSFYKAYPMMPSNNDKLNWSHYRTLSGIKDRGERKYLEDLVVEKDLSEKALIKTIKKSKTKKLTVKPETGDEKLPLRRGNLFCYKLITPVGSDVLHIDCGFKIYHRAEGILPKDAKVVESKKTAAGYSFKKSAVGPRQIYTYKAFLNRVVDGDTLHATLDLGFGIMHEETLRLCAINAPESDTKEGRNATKALTEILQKQPYFIVRTSSTDQYNRYLADIFLIDKEADDLQKTADNGVYLNQLLLDKKLVNLFIFKK